ncbi:MAG: molybdenum cofactor guanylyltransferase, partial [Deltaproteobacteria bacterium]|nr:molybdenum cofactor guanylyltransferase [Deltaproteobacteria bacterium]
MSKIAEVTGIILAGGRSSRFGENKAFATFHGIPLVDRVVNLLSPLFEELLLVTNRPEEFQKLRLPILVDRVPYQGPLGGIATALEVSRNDRIFVVACDMPILRSSTIQKVVGAAGESHAVIPVHDGVREYLMGLYSRKLLPRMLENLEAGKLSVAELLLSGVPVT